MRRLPRCGACGVALPRDAGRCPSCGHDTGQGVVVAVRNDELEAAGVAPRDDPGPEYEQAAAHVLDETVVELRATPAPDAVRAEFDHGYLLVEQLAQALREPGTDTAHRVNQIWQLGLGLTRCTFALPASPG